MRLKISFIWSCFIVSILGIVFFLTIIFFLNLALPDRDSYTKTASPTSGQTLQSLINDKSAASTQSIVCEKPASSGLPIRLKIPKINVDAALEYVGLTSDGAMDVPKSQDDAAWFNLGPRPGENGSAVIAGHYGWKNRKASAFDNLHKLREGDKLYIEDDKGMIISFVVRAIQRYEPNADASDVFGSNDDKSHLNLVTCEGVWNKVFKSYSKRLVIFTDKE